MFGENLKMDEDSYHEFKMHSKNLLSEIQKSKYERNRNGKIVRLNQPNSKVICAFLNTKGGKLFLGVNDNGDVVGLPMSAFQVDHVILSLNRMLESFTPPVPPSLIQVETIKIRRGQETEEIFHNNETDVYFNGASGTLEHMIGGHFCYCFQSSEYHQSARYLIVITVAQAENVIFQNEEGLVYIRSNGSNRILTIDTLRQYKKNQYISKSLPLPTYEKKKSVWNQFVNMMFTYFW